MKVNKLKMVAAASALLLASGGAMATSITNTSGTYNNFGGFDWASNGTAVVDGFDPLALTGGNSTFDLTYWADASEVQDPFGNAIIAASAGLLFGNYEYTIRALLNETSTCTADDGTICTSADFAVNSGSFDIWYDVTDNSSLVTGAGITDGIALMSGTILAQPGGGFDIISGGFAFLDAVITSTNNTYINPDLVASTAATTLQIGSTSTSWVAPSSMPGAGGGTVALPGGYIALQADGNQNFEPSAVPEPESLALLGLGLLGLAFTRRQGKKA